MKEISALLPRAGKEKVHLKWFLLLCPAPEPLTLPAH